jgi:hypothetical protein
VTVAAVWFNGGVPYLGSDSRLTVGLDHVDTSVKVTAFTMAFLEPSSAGWSSGRAFHRHSIGLCAAGSVAPTMAVKESLRALVERMWAVPGLADLSMETVAEVVAAILHPLWHKAVAALGADEQAVIAIGGWCPVKKRGRAFVLRTDGTTYPAKVVYKEVLPTDPPYYFGSGASEATRVSGDDPQLTPLQVIRRVIDEGRVGSVGGRVQAGVLEGTDFTICTIHDYTVDHRLREVRTGHFLGGLQLMNHEAMPLPDGISILPKSLLPFEQDISAFHSQGYTLMEEGQKVIVLFDGDAAREKIVREAAKARQQPT